MRRDILRFSALCGWTSLDAAIILLDGKLCASPFLQAERKEPSFYAICCSPSALAPAMGRAGPRPLCRGAPPFGGRCPGQPVLFSAAQSLGLSRPLPAGGLRPPHSGRRAGFLPLGRRLRHLGRGRRLFLLDVIEPELYLRLGLRQLPAQAI